MSALDEYIDPDLISFVSAVGSIMNARWFTMGAVTTGEFCTAQG